MVSVITLSACSSSKRASGGYYKDDGPGSNIPANIMAIPDAQPKIETPRPANMRPYTALGKRYVPISTHQPFRQKGIASWYGKKFHGRKTASGEIYDMYAMTAAHPTLPLPSYARVTHARTGKSIVVRINDRGPFHASRIIDLSYVAAAKLDLIGPGSGPVIVEAITNDDIRAQTESSKVATTATQQTALYKPQEESVSTNDAINQIANQQQTNTSESKEGSVFLQYGAFSAPENASKLASEINQNISGVESKRANVVKVDSLHRVHIGPYNDRTSAVNAAIRIRSATGLDASYVQKPDFTSKASL